MKTIKTITRYKYDGKEYDNLNKVKEVVENRIGEMVIDEVFTPYHGYASKMKLEMLKILCSPDVRKELLDLLNLDFETETDMNPRTKWVNILDI